MKNAKRPISLLMAILLTLGMLTGIVLPATAVTAPTYGKVENVTVIGQNVGDYSTETASSCLTDGLYGAGPGGTWSNTRGRREAYLTFDLGATRSLKTIVSHARTNFPKSNAREFEVYVTGTAPVYSETLDEGVVPTGLPEEPTMSGEFAQCAATVNTFATADFPAGTTGRYVTLHIKNTYETTGNAYIRIGEIEFFAPREFDMEIDSIASTSSYNGYGPEYLYDGLTGGSTYWSTKATSVTSADLTVTLKEASTVSSVVLYPKQVAQFPASVTVAVSSDNETYETVLTKEDTTITAVAPQYFSFDSKDNVKYVKITVTRPDSKVYIYLDEIEVLGQKVYDASDSDGDRVISNMNGEVPITYVENMTGITANAYDTNYPYTALIDGRVDDLTAYPYCWQTPDGTTSASFEVSMRSACEVTGITLHPVPNSDRVAMPKNISVYVANAEGTYSIVPVIEVLELENRTSTDPLTLYFDAVQDVTKVKVVVDGSDTTYINMSEVDVLAVAPRKAAAVKIVNATATSNHNSTPITRLYDQKRSTYWASGQVANTSVTLELESSSVLTGLTLTPADKAWKDPAREKAISQFPESITVYTSTDGEVWSEAIMSAVGFDFDDNLGATCDVNAYIKPQTFWFEPQLDVKFIKLDLTRADGCSYAEIAEVEPLCTALDPEIAANSVTELRIDYENNCIVMPEFDNCEVEITSSSNQAVVALDGTVDAIGGGTAEVVLRITNIAGETALTAPITVTVLGLRQRMATIQKVIDATASNNNPGGTAMEMIAGEANSSYWSKGWVSDGTSKDAELIFTLAEPADVAGVVLLPYSDKLDSFPQNYEFFTSSDKETWKSVGTVSDYVVPEELADEKHKFYFPIESDVKYIKVNVTCADSQTVMRICKFEYLEVPAVQTATDAAAALTVEQSGETMLIEDISGQFTTEITQSSNEALVVTDGKIVLPAEATDITLTIKVTNRLDTTDVVTVTRDVTVKTADMLAVEAVAKETDLIPCPENDATQITCPSVPEGYTIKVVASDHPDIVDATGKITRSDDTTYGVRLTFEITHTASGATARTKELLVPIYKTYVAPTMSEEEIEKIHRDYESKSYGVFVHYIPEYRNVTGTIYRDGQVVENVDELAEGFDVVQFAKDMDDFGAEYVVFTVIHDNDSAIFPSMTMERWREDRRSESCTSTKPYADRDVIMELLDELDKYDIDLHLYTRTDASFHYDEEDRWNVGYYGYDPDPEQTVWMEYIMEFHYELVERYGTRLAGIWNDGHVSPLKPGQDQEDYRNLMRMFNPAMELTMNSGFHRGETNLFSHFNYADNKCWEINSYVEYEDVLQVSRHQTGAVLAGDNWWAQRPQAQSFKIQPAEEMFRYIAAISSISVEGGFAAALGNYAVKPTDTTNDLWPCGMKDMLTKVGTYLSAVKESVANTSIGVAYPTKENSIICNLEWGVSTESRDGKNIYFHVLNAPEGDTLNLSETADGTILGTDAVVLNLDGTTTEGVTVTKTESGYAVTLPEGKTWDTVDTVIKAERTGYDETIPMYSGDKVFYDPTVEGLEKGTKVIRTVEGVECYLVADVNAIGEITDDGYPVVDGVKQVHFLAKEYEPFSIYFGSYALYGAKAGINPNDPEDITKANALRTSDEGETVLIGGGNTSLPGGTIVLASHDGKITLDGFTVKGNAKCKIGVETRAGDNVDDVTKVDIINCRNSNAEDAYGVFNDANVGSNEAFIDGWPADHKIVNIKTNRFDGICFSKAPSALIDIRNWEGVVEGNYISMKNSVNVANGTTTYSTIFNLSGESYSGKDWDGKQDVTIQNNHLEGRVSTAVNPKWYDEYKVHVLNNTIAPTVSGYSLINLYVAGSATVDGETKYYSNIDTADIQISGNKVINPYAVGLAFVNIYGTVTATSAEQIAEINAYKAGNIKITHNELDYGTVSGNAFAGTAVKGYDNLVFDIACNKYGATVNPVKSGLAVNFAALSDADEAAHKQVEIVEEIAPTLTTEGTGNKACAFCGTVLEENMVLPATGEAIIGTTGYATLEEALKASKAEDVIQLLNDVTAEELMVKNGVTLDLNGKILTADYLVSFNGASVVDATDTGTGKLAIAKENLALSKNNSYLPVYDEENGCYLFTRVKNDRIAVTTEGGKPKYSTSPMFKAYAHPLMDTEAEAAASGVDVIIRLTWSDSNGQYEGSQDYTFFDTSIAEVMGSYVSENGTANYEKQFYGIFVGSEIESGVDVYVSTVVKSSAGVEMESAKTALFTAE